MPTYPTPHIEWAFSIPSTPDSAREVSLSLDGIDGNKETTLIAALTGQYIGDTGFLSALSSVFGATSDLLSPDPDISVNLTLNGDGYIQIELGDDSLAAIYVHPSDFLTSLGFGEVTVEVGIGETYVFPNHPRWLWHPRMVTQRDTGDVPRNVTMTSETITARPVEVVHTDDWFERVIRWQTVAACLVHNHRAEDANFAQAAPKTTGDTNNTLENLANYVRNDVVDSYDHPNVIVREIGGAASEDYTLNLTRSKLAGGIKDENSLYTETAMESYTVELHFRRD